MIQIDERAKEMAKIWGMPSDVHIPIGARDKEAIEKYIGSVTSIKNLHSEKALIVKPHICPDLNPRLPLWKLKESAILHFKIQVWVHVDYSNYRIAYMRAFPEENVKGYFIDHILNRRVARLKGFNYLRIIPVSPSVNSSSGGITEKYGFSYHSTARMKKINQKNQPFIEYADITAIVKISGYNKRFLEFIN